MSPARRLRTPLRLLPALLLIADPGAGTDVPTGGRAMIQQSRGGTPSRIPPSDHLRSRVPGAPEWGGALETPREAVGAGAAGRLGARTRARDTLRVLAYNVHHGEGMDSVLDLERIASVIRSVDPDLVALQEIDSVTSRTGGVDQAAELGRLTGMHARYGRFMSYRGGAYGMAVLSRWPIEATSNLRLPDGEEPRTALSVTVRSPAGQRLRFVGIHLYRTESERLAQATALDSLLEGSDTPTVLAGDFNSTPDSPVMSYLAESWAVVPKGEDRLTFASYDPVREIDFVLVGPAGRFEVLSQRLLDEPVASDHRPVFVELALDTQRE